MLDTAKLFALYQLCDLMVRVKGTPNFRGNNIEWTVEEPQRDADETEQDFLQRRHEFLALAPGRSDDYSRRLAFALTALEDAGLDQLTAAYQIKELIDIAKQGCEAYAKSIAGLPVTVVPVRGRLGQTKRGRRTTRVKMRAGVEETIRTQALRYRKNRVNFEYELKMELASFIERYARGPQWYSEAETAMRERLDRTTQRYRANHEWPAACHADLGYLFHEQEKFPEALRHYQAALQFWSLQLAIVRKTLAVLEQLGTMCQSGTVPQPRPAQSVFREAVRIAGMTLRPSRYDWDISIGGVKE
jgi:hypothetical protein